MERNGHLLRNSMSKFYYCEDCKKAVNLDRKKTDEFWRGKIDYITVCDSCKGSNWKAIIDSPNGEPKECL